MNTFNLFYFLYIFSGFSGDGDSRIISSMKSISGIGSPEKVPIEFSSFFVGNLSPTLANFQDFMHLCVKLLRRTMKTLRIGIFSISASHLRNIKNLFGKDRHLLIDSDLKDEDKMSYGVVEKICSVNVESCLQSTPNAQGTIIYLKLIKFLQMAFIETDTSTVNRIKLAFHVVFLCRIWRTSLQKETNFGDSSFASTAKTFITANCYQGIEINAHSLIVCILLFRDLGLDGNFLVFLFSSQTCESFFRILRSMTSTFSTIVNFNLLEVLQRVKRSQALAEIINKLKSQYHFARTEKGKEKESSFKLPSNAEIVASINQALQEAVEDAEILGKI